ncbi:MAG: TonB-dependent receptor [Chitinophagaceae bacterium]
MTARFVLFFTGLIAFFATEAQEISFSSDSAKLLTEVVVTATRTERRLGNVAVPVSIISQKQIQQAGSLRLKDLLLETTGLFLTAGFGAGVQMQGLNPDYTLILIDGEPLVGRTAGVLDLNRIAIGNIKKIEIVKGPSSSLYGSEAMAGVINIITDRSRKELLNASLRYGFGNPDEGWSLPFGNKAFKQTDVSFNAGVTLSKFSFKYSGNALYSDVIGYRINSNNRVPQPVGRFTNMLKLGYTVNEKAVLDVSIRNGYDYIKKEISVSNIGGVSNSYGREINNDWNINPVFTYKFSKKVKSAFRGYISRFNGDEKLRFKEKPDSLYYDGFFQRFYKAENQTDITLKNMTFTGGAGYIIDQARSTRYDNSSSVKQNTIAYGFLQYEWTPVEKMNVIAGLRYDDNKLYAAAFSPKLAVRYNFSTKFYTNASIGRGFKAPDFRQLYLNFTNVAAGGYSVFGTIDAIKIITQLQQRGEIAELTDDFNKLSTLTPEYSTGVNIGAGFMPSSKLSVTINLFRNDIDNLIESRQVATRNNGTQIYSYINVKKAYTQGLETEIKWMPVKNLTLTTGYQFLLTADKEELKRIKQGLEPVRDNNNISRTLLRSEYFGLPNRSRHMANLKLTYENKDQVFATVRSVYRSRWAISNTSGNTVYDEFDEFAAGFVMVNLSAGKEFKNGIRLQAGMDNVLNYQDINNLPNLNGRTIYTSIFYDFNKNKKTR